MNSIRPISDLRNKFTDISKFVHQKKQPVFLTNKKSSRFFLQRMVAAIWL